MPRLLQEASVPPGLEWIVLSVSPDSLLLRFSLQGDLKLDFGSSCELRENVWPESLMLTILESELAIAASTLS